VGWVVAIGDEFQPEFFALQEDVQTETLALSRLLQKFGPQLGRPRVDTLKGSRHANRKELRFAAGDGEWRVAFAFDARRKAILPVAGDAEFPDRAPVVPAGIAEHHPPSKPTRRKHAHPPP